MNQPEEIRSHLQRAMERMNQPRGAGAPVAAVPAQGTAVCGRTAVVVVTCAAVRILHLHRLLMALQDRR